MTIEDAKRRYEWRRQDQLIDIYDRMNELVDDVDAADARLQREGDTEAMIVLDFGDGPLGRLDAMGAELIEECPDANGYHIEPHPHRPGGLIGITYDVMPPVEDVDEETLEEFRAGTPEIREKMARCRIILEDGIIGEPITHRSAMSHAVVDESVDQKVNYLEMQLERSVYEVLRAYRTELAHALAIEEYDGVSA